jgi:tRNA(Arg) A34 adenosine deaminase TadA
MRNELVRRVVELAEEALSRGSFPNGALVAMEDDIVCESISMSEQGIDPTAHAEISVIREACKKKKTVKLQGHTLYTSLEPCMMCFHGSYWAGIRKIVYCCTREKVSQFCFEGTMSSVQEAHKHTHKPVELVYDGTLADKVVTLHEKFRENLQ